MAEKKKRGGNHKIAPEGYYTSKQARERLGLSTSTFIYYVQKGKIKRYVPPMRVEGFYKKEEIDRMATEIALFFHTELGEEESPIETRIATEKDGQGIHDVLSEGFGWNTASVALRLSWYKRNPLIDYVVILDSRVAGYIHFVAYPQETLEDMMAGRKRAWDITPDEILPYSQEHPNDLYIGAAVRQDIPNPKIVARRLLSGFMAFLESLAEQGIIIHALYAVSAEKDGQRLCRKLGFIQQPTQAGDLFKDARFILDLETSDSRFAQQYREAIKRQK